MEMKVVTLLASLFAFTHAADHKMIVFGMSGLRHDYVDKSSLPTFHLFRTGGFQAMRMEIPMVTNSWPSLWTIATGLWPEEHGIIDDNMYDPTIDEPFTAGVTRVDALWFPYKPIWISAEEDGIKTAVSGWPGSEVRYGNTQASKFHSFISGESEEDTRIRIEDFCSWIYDGADLGLFMLPEPDNTGHETGAGSDEVHEALKQNDRLLSYLMDTLEDLGIDVSKTNFIVVGDHGMVDHHSSHVTYLSDHGVNLGDMRWVTSNLFTTGMILPHEGLIDNIYTQLTRGNATNYMTAYLKKDLPERFHIKNHRRTPPIVVVPHLGYRIELTRPHTDFQSPDRTLGMHGYDSDNVEMMPSMLALGPDFNRTKLEQIRSIDIYPLMCSLLQLTKCHGTDATIDVPEKMVNGGKLTDNRPAKLNYAFLNTGKTKKLVRATYAPEPSSSSTPQFTCYSTLLVFFYLLL